MIRHHHPGDTEMTELLPCPFCGGEAGVGSDDAYDDVTWQVFCKQCYATIERDLRDHAVALWNTRSTPTIVERRIGELAERAYAEGVEDGIGWHCFPESGPRPQWIDSDTRASLEQRSDQ
jgi:Lar family restriction alleviation protein